MTDHTPTGERAPDELHAERFAIVPEWLLAEAAPVVKLYALLDRYAGRDRRAWPGQAELAERMDCSDRTVRSHLKRLQEVGALREEKRRWNGTTVYSLLPVRPEASFRLSLTDRKPVAAPSGNQLPPNESHEREPSRTPIARGVPASFVVSDELRAWGVENTPTVNLDDETAAFLDHHAAKGSTFKDWAAAWRKWMRNAAKYEAERQTNGNGRRPMTTVERSFRNILAED